MALILLILLLLGSLLETARAQEVEVTRINAEAEVTVKSEKRKEPFIGEDDDFEGEPRFRRGFAGRRGGYSYYP